MASTPNRATRWHRERAEAIEKAMTVQALAREICQILENLPPDPDTPTLRLVGRASVRAVA